jgi:hypothetical protein
MTSAGRSTRTSLLRTVEISNWTGKAVAAPRTELEPTLLALREHHGLHIGFVLVR